MAGPPHRAVAILTILAAALVLMAPEFAVGLTRSDSSLYTLVWSDQFTAALRRGTLYPRWLPASWHGLGSPAFYFYPPLFFWIEAVVAIGGGGLLPGTSAITAASTIVLATSGLAMRAWLRGLGSDRIALVGALVYMAAPYHLRDLYIRGAVAEACAYALLPLVLLAMRRLAAGTGGVAALAVAYAGLILAHLPSALLASVSILPAYALNRAWRRADSAATLAAMAAGAGLGLALAAVYLVPSLGLAGAISTDLGDRGFYAAQTNVLLNAGHWLGSPLHAVAIALSIAAMVLATLAAATSERRRDGTRASWFWAGLTIAVATLVIGLVPGVWRLPGLAAVQFPWRMLLIAEFATVTAVAIGRPRATMPAMIVALTTLGPLWTIELSAIRTQLEPTASLSADVTTTARSDHPDAPEYLPHGLLHQSESGRPADPERVAASLSHPPTVSAPGARIVARAMPDGGLDVTSEAPAPTYAAVARFRFPGWRVTQDGRPLPITGDGHDGHDGLVGWRVAAGAHRYRLRIGTTPQERVGATVSLLAALLTAAIALRRRLRGGGLPTGAQGV